MKIDPAPPPQLPKGVDDLKALALAAAAPPFTDERHPFALAHNWTVRNRPLDEAAIALVELSVLIYERLGTVRRVFARTRFDFAAFSPHEDRQPDLERLRAHAARVAEARAAVSAFPLTPSPDPVVQQHMVAAFAAIKAATPVDVEARTAARRNAAERALHERPARVIAFRDGSDVVIAFRGTQTAADWGRDAMAWPAARMPLRHYGFEICWQEVRAPLEAWLERQTQALGRAPTLYIGGHSLGGAMACLAAIDLAHAGFPIARVVTIGCPRAGGRGLRKAYAASAATPGPDGPRTLPKVSTRFVHGTDVFTSVIPPPPLAVHMCPAESLKAADGLQRTDFITPYGPADLTTVMTRLLGTEPTPYTMPGLVAPPKPSALSTARLALTQIATWIAIARPGTAWRFAPLVPAIVEQIRVMCFQHKSARYLNFFPHTEIGWAMFDVRAEDERVVHEVVPPALHPAASA